MVRENHIVITQWIVIIKKYINFVARGIEESNNGENGSKLKTTALKTTSVFLMESY